MVEGIETVGREDTMGWKNKVGWEGEVERQATLGHGMAEDGGERKEDTGRQE